MTSENNDNRIDDFDYILSINIIGVRYIIYNNIIFEYFYNIYIGGYIILYWRDLNSIVFVNA